MPAGQYQRHRPKIRLLPPALLPDPQGLHSRRLARPLTPQNRPPIPLPPHRAGRPASLALPLSRLGGFPGGHRAKTAPNSLPDQSASPRPSAKKKNLSALPPTNPPPPAPPRRAAKRVRCDPADARSVERGVRQL